MRRILPLFLVLCAFWPDRLFAHEESAISPVARWHFWPLYTLPGEAANYPGPRLESPKTPFQIIDQLNPPLLFFGEGPTERISRLLPRERIPDRAFSVELWAVTHETAPVGGLMAVQGREGESPAAWVLGLHDETVLFSLNSADPTRSTLIEATSPEGWKKYWHHLVGTYDGTELKLFHNGKPVAQRAAAGRVALPAGVDLEIAAYLKGEPHMQLANLLREARLYDRALKTSEIVARFHALQHLVNHGVLFDNLFHFTAGPYLNFATQESMGIVWETDRPAAAVVRYGTRVPYDQSLRLNEAKRLHEITLSHLEPESNYFYEITASEPGGKEIRSGPLTFKTAVRDESAFSFAVIGDTETRPYINDLIAKGIWSERPNFLVHVGDLTDGGQEHHKFEWNFEYFLGMNQIISRIPMFPVPGNGESDLYWYSRYHRLPAPENYYTFRFGNAEFFMLDSNRSMGPGSEQYDWLDRQLSRSQAQWKFAAHHHPTYSSEADDYGNSWRGPSREGDLNARSLVPLYEKHGVDIVFFGHLHCYERTWPVAEGRINQQRGVRYVQAGGGGGTLEDFAPNRTWFSTKTYRGHHYCILNVHEGFLSFKMFDLEGRLRDAFEIRK